MITGGSDDANNTQEVKHQDLVRRCAMLTYVVIAKDGHAIPLASWNKRAILSAVRHKQISPRWGDILKGGGSRSAKKK